MHEPLVAAVSEFTQAILNPYDPDDLLDRLIGHVTTTLRAAGAGIMLEDAHGDLDFAAASGERIAKMERIQAKVETGVCYEAFVTNQVVIATDLATMERWPEYAARAREVGFASVLGVPLNAWGQTIGVLNVYREDAGEWTDEEIGAAQILAAMGAAYVLNASQLRAQHELTDNLQEALSSRGVIERAKGILMAREDVDADTAFEALRDASMERNRKLRDVAQDLVDRAESR